MCRIFRFHFHEKIMYSLFRLWSWNSISVFLWNICRIHSLIWCTRTLHRAGWHYDPITQLVICLYVCMRVSLKYFFLKLNYVSNLDLIWAGLVLNKHSCQTYFKPTFICNDFLSRFSSDELVRDEFCLRQRLLMLEIMTSLEKINVDRSFTTQKKKIDLIFLRFNSRFKLFFHKDSFHTWTETNLLCRRSKLRKRQMILILSEWKAL